jgi:hypothetical protein
LGDTFTRSDAQALAQSLSEASVDQWPALTRCARDYCTISERIQGNLSLLGDAVRRGDTEFIHGLIESEQDNARRGIIMLAASLLLHESPQQELSSTLRVGVVSYIQAGSFQTTQRILLHATLDSSELPVPEWKKRREGGGHNWLDAWDGELGLPAPRDQAHSAPTPSDSKTARLRRFLPAIYLRSAGELHIFLGIAAMMVGLTAILKAYYSPTSLVNEWISFGLGMGGFLLMVGLPMATVMWLNHRSSTFLNREQDSLRTAMRNLLENYRSGARAARERILDGVLRLHRLITEPGMAFREERSKEQALNSRSKPWASPIGKMLYLELVESDNLSRSARLIEKAICDYTAPEVLASIRSALQHMDAEMRREVYDRLTGVQWSQLQRFSLHKVVHDDNSVLGTLFVESLRCFDLIHLNGIRPWLRATSHTVLAKGLIATLNAEPVEKFMFWPGAVKKL